MNYWRLDSCGRPRRCDFAEYAAWWLSLPCSQRCGGGALIVNQYIGNVRVSTKFRAMTPAGQRLPELYETMVFGGPLDLSGRRYCTAAEAREGHAAMIHAVRQALRQQGVIVP